MNKHTFFALSLLSFAFLFFACEQDDIVTTDTSPTSGIQISGTIMVDIDGDTIGDIPAVNTIVYYFTDTVEMFDNLDPFFQFGDEPTDYPAPLGNAPFTYTDADGHYTIDVAEVSDGSIWCHHPAEYFSCTIYGTDQEPDGDPSETDTLWQIHTTLIVDEHDTGNNFTLVACQ